MKGVRPGSLGKIPGMSRNREGGRLVETYIRLFLRVMSTLSLFAISC